MARFEREEQLLASLNHPNIATIHGLEESNGVRALVMEPVERPTLGERIGGQFRGKNQRDGKSERSRIRMHDNVSEMAASSLTGGV